SKAGLPALVLERRAVIGGTSVIEEIHPGFRCPTVMHCAGSLLPQIARDMQLDKRGLVTLRPDVRLLALDPEGPSMRIYEDPQKTAAGLMPLSSQDGKKYPEFHASFEHLGRAIRPLLSVTPPDIDHLTFNDYLNLGRLGW